MQLRERKQFAVGESLAVAADAPGGDHPEVVGLGAGLERQAVLAATFALGVLLERFGEGELLLLRCQLSLLAGFFQFLGLLLGPVDAVARQGADASSLCFGIGKLDLTGPVAVLTRQAVLALVLGSP